MRIVAFTIVVIHLYISDLFILRCSGLPGGKNKSPSTQADAIRKMEDAEESLRTELDILKRKITSELTIAKEHAKDDKRAAFRALKKKKRYQKQLQEAENLLRAVQLIRTDLENGRNKGKTLARKYFNLSPQEVTRLTKDFELFYISGKDFDDEAKLDDVADVDEDKLNAELEELEQM